MNSHELACNLHSKVLIQLDAEAFNETF